MNLESYAHPASLPSSVSFRVARLLALEVEDPEDMGDLQLAKRIAGGLQPSSVFALGDVIGKSRVIGAMVPEATLRRARKAGKPLSRELSERLYEVGRVVDAVSVVYHGDRGSIEAFLNRSHSLLDGESPLDVARSSSAGAVAVLNLVRRIEASVVV